MNGLRAPGGVKVDVSWENGKWQAAISLGRTFPARRLDVFLPGRTALQPVELSPGESIVLSGGLSETGAAAP